MVEGNPGGAGGTVEQRIEQRPVGDCVGAILHRLGLAVRAGDGTRIEVIAADHDRRPEFAARDHLVEREPETMPVAKPDPTDAGGQPLELNARLRHVEPVVQVPVVRHQLLDLGVGAEDVLWVT
jgi:hypothetical protein